MRFRSIKRTMGPGIKGTKSEPIMATSDGALKHILDLLGPVEPEAKRMLGGLNIF